MSKLFYSVAGLSLCLIAITDAAAHAEHDKPRFVAASGEDKGYCENALEPCKTIRYAAQHSNKGDIIKVASGNYAIDNADTLFYLLSQTIPIKSNFSRVDNFEERNNNNITRLTGVPLEYVEVLSAKGFSVIVDSKGQSSPENEKLKNKLGIYSRLKQSQAETICSDGSAGDFPCNNIDLLAHVALSSFSTNPSAGNDIWGHYDLNDNSEYALIGLSNGIGIVNVTDPVNPTVVTTISSQSTSWRDLKVYQAYDTTTKRWKSYAYVTADSASVGLLIIDLSSLPASAAVVATDRTDVSAHNVYLSNVDYSTGVTLTGRLPYLHIAGSNRNGGAFKTYGLDDPKAIDNTFTPTDATRSNYTHDVASMNITDDRKDSQCVNGTDHCEVFFDFNENDFQLWDKTDNATPSRLSTTSYANAAYVHSGWYTEDKLTVIVHDELDEQQSGLNTTVRFFDMSNLKRPTAIATWSGPTRAIDHNGFVRGNRYYMSNYERGMTVLDITNPSSPVETGFFDTYPLNDSASFNGAWGVYPFLPSGNILVSDINSGLYILRDKTLASDQGSLSFSASNYSASEGDDVSISVARSDGSTGNTKVGWELSTGSAQTNDFALASGELEWTTGETESKTISVAITNDNLTEEEELFFIRLFNPENGATLKSPSMATVKIAASTGNSAPSANAGVDQNVQVDSSVFLTGTASDPDGDSLTYLWEQISGNNVNLQNETTLNASFTPDTAGNFEFRFSATDLQNNTTSDEITILVEEQVNVAPTVSAGNDVTADAGITVSLTGTASDADGDSLTYAWTQLSGTAVILSSSNTLVTSFSGVTAGAYSFQFTATDSNGAASSASVNVTLNALVSPTPAEPTESSGSGSFGIFGLAVLGLFGFWVRLRKFI